MAGGLAVVATSTGGSAEIFENGVNSLIFRAGDYEDCARQTVRLLKDPDLFKRMVCVGHKEVTEKFALDGMLDRIERHLMRIVQMKQNLEVVS
jgi:glycosyltransferase involved in cell wall biosynthesis